LRLIGGSPRMGFRLWLPLTLALSPQAGRGDLGGTRETHGAQPVSPRSPRDGYASQLAER